MGLEDKRQFRMRLNNIIKKINDRVKKFYSLLIGNFKVLRNKVPLFNRIKWIYLLSLIFIPLLISLLCLFPFDERIQLTKIPLEDKNWAIKVSAEEVNRVSLKNTIRKLFSVPFDLDYYNLCVENNGSTIISPSGIVKKDSVELLLELLGENISVRIGETKCGHNFIKKESLYTFNQSMTANLTYSREIISRLKTIESGLKGEEMQIKWDYEIYAKPNSRDVIIENALFLISTLSLWWLITRIGTLVIKNN